MQKPEDMRFYGVTAVAIVAVISASYLYVTQSGDIEALQEFTTKQEQQINQKNAELSTASSTISALETTISDIQEDLEDLADDYHDEKDRNEEFEDQIKYLAGTLGDLDKLANTDEELLRKYSKVAFLNENYIPERLKEIDEDYVLDGKGDQYFLSKAMEHLEDMLDAAEDDGMDIKIVSAYRSFDEQNELKGQFTQIYGEGANAFSADQGFSEHQLGTTLDLTTPSVGGTYNSFADTPEYQWLLDNGHKYGFILSYHEGNDYYIFEPWHWRFVSIELARDLERKDDIFYDLEQRDIDKYLLEFFD